MPPRLDATAPSLPRRGPGPSKQAAVAKVASSGLGGGPLKQSQAQGLTSNSPLVYLASGTLTISSSLISGMPWGGQRGLCCEGLRGPGPAARQLSRNADPEPKPPRPQASSTSPLPGQRRPKFYPHHPLCKEGATSLLPLTLRPGAGALGNGVKAHQGCTHTSPGARWGLSTARGQQTGVRPPQPTLALPMLLLALPLCDGCCGLCLSFPGSPRSGPSPRESCRPQYAH